jgi:hypothetical protein
MDRRDKMFPRRIITTRRYVIPEVKNDNDRHIIEKAAATKEI